MKQAVGFGAAGLVVLAVLTYGIGTGSPLIPRWMVVYGAAVLTLGLLAFALCKNTTITLLRSELLVLVFIGYLALSLVWSSDPRDGLLTVEAVFVLWLLYVGLTRLPRAQLVGATYVGATIALGGATVFGFAYPLIYGGVGNENFQAEMFLVLLPLVIAAWVAIKTPVAWLRWFALPATLAALYFILFVNLSDSKWVAASAGLLAVVVWLGRRKRYTAAGFAVLVPLNVAILSGWATSSVVVKAIIHRLEIGLNSALLWAERPLLGHGLGSFNYEYGRFQEAHLRFFPEMDTVLRPSSVFAGAAHNELLQLGADAGLIGLLLGLSLIGALIWRFITKRKDAADIGAGMALLVAAGLSQISFPLQNPATLTIVVFAAAVLMQGERPVLRLAVPRLQSIALCGVLCAGGIGLAYSASLSYRAERLFKDTRANIEIAHPAALQANLDAHKLYPYDRRYRHQLMLTVGALLKNAHGNVVITKEAADRAYRISQSAAAHMPAIKLTRLEYLLNTERWREERAEVEELLVWLKQHARLQPGVWLAEGSYAVRTGNVERLLRALDAGGKLPTRTHDEGFRVLASYLKVN